jgi:uncharacterized protein
MLLDLNKLHGQREHVERTLPPSVFEPDVPDARPDYRVASPVELTLDVVKSGDAAFTVAGTARTRLELECGRCLDPFELPFDAAFELRYVPEPKHPVPAQAGADRTAEDDDGRELGEDDLATAFYRDGMLDVVELLREQFQLALPMKPLCSEACRGLCPECGTNRNRNECACAPAWEDPRLAPLKNLLSRSKET